MNKNSGSRSRDLASVTPHVTRHIHYSHICVTSMFCYMSHLLCHICHTSHLSPCGHVKYGALCQAEVSHLSHVSRLSHVTSVTCHISHMPHVKKMYVTSIKQNVSHLPHITCHYSLQKSMSHVCHTSNQSSCVTCIMCNNYHISHPYHTSHFTPITCHMWHPLCMFHVVVTCDRCDM